MVNEQKSDANATHLQTLAWILQEVIQQFAVVESEDTNVRECKICGAQSFLAWGDIDHKYDCLVTRLSNLIASLEGNHPVPREETIDAVVLWPNKEGDER